MAENKITILGIVHHESWLPFNIRSKGQGHRVTECKRLEGDQVTNMGLHSVEWPESSFSKVIKFHNLAWSAANVFQAIRTN